MANFVKELRANRANGIEQAVPQFTIPVVIHVFHDGDTAKVDMAQIQSGLDVLNNDFLGLNTDFNTIDPRFDSIKASLDIQFCLATIDTNGNPTTGVIYYDDSIAMLNGSDLFVHAWDNYKYLNIYMPRFTAGQRSLFTAYAYYPSTAGSNANQGGVFYSSIRWGYGLHSELNLGQEWASVITHEMGHWLGLFHTFEFGCQNQGDLIADTPPTLGGTIFTARCNNNDSTCGVPTNGSNYMDYNHDCKKMFTRDQVDVMYSVLSLPSRITLWSEANLIATGCKPDIGLIEEDSPSSSLSVYPNPSQGSFMVSSNKTGYYSVVDVTGKIIAKGQLNKEIDLNDRAKGVYFVVFNNESVKLILQ